MMEFELPKINVSFEYDKEKDETVFVINGVEKRVKTEDMITEMEKLQEQNTAYEDIDKEEIAISVVLLDLFTKNFCRYRNDYERFDDLKFRCHECPFRKENGECLVKLFKNKYAPNYRDFGSMGDL